MYCIYTHTLSPVALCLRHTHGARHRAPHPRVFLLATELTLTLFIKNVLYFLTHSACSAIVTVGPVREVLRFTVSLAGGCAARCSRPVAARGDVVRRRPEPRVGGPCTRPSTRNLTVPVRRRCGRSRGEPIRLMYLQGALSRAGAVPYEVKQKYCLDMAGTIILLTATPLGMPIL